MLEVAGLKMCLCLSCGIGSVPGQEFTHVQVPSSPPKKMAKCFRLIVISALGVNKEIM